MKAGFLIYLLGKKENIGILKGIVRFTENVEWVAIGYTKNSTRDYFCRDAEVSG